MCLYYDDMPDLLRLGFIRIPCFMIIIPYLFIPTLIYQPLEYFLLDIICYMHIVLTLLRHLVLLYHSPGEYHLTPLDSHVQVMELGACGFSQLMHQSGAAVAWIPADHSELHPSRPPCESLEFSFLNS